MASVYLVKEYAEKTTDLSPGTEKLYPLVFYWVHNACINGHRLQRFVLFCFVCLMMFKATFNNTSLILWRSVLLVEETGVPGGRKHHHMLYRVHLTMSGIRTHNLVVIGNDFTITTAPYHINDNNNINLNKIRFFFFLFFRDTLIYIDLPYGVM